MAAFIANVGVNSGHAARSPLFAEGNFHLLPIPERHAWRPPMLRLQDLPELAAYTPRAWHSQAMHVDPDLTSSTPTYGDNCRRAGRAFSLRRAATGDVIVFLARLQPPAAPAAFHLVGCLVIDDVLADVSRDPGCGWWDNNAHVRRARAIADWDSFWIFKGRAGSRLFQRAVRFSRSEGEYVFDGTWRWASNRTELQTIGSYTRSVRRVVGAGEEWLRTICRS